LFSLLMMYLALSSGQFIAIDIFLLFSILTWIFPIISTALYSPLMKLKTYVIPEKIVEEIGYED
jgi:hypothetical protein